MKFKIINILIIILFVISLIISVLNIRTTYAKYQEQVDTDYQVDIRKWYIVVNGEDIQNEEIVLSQVLQPHLIENEHMKDDVIVPGREGYFEIDVDYTKVDVPFTYSFDIEQTNTTKLTDLEFYGYSIVEEGSEFEIGTVEDEIIYVGMEEGTGTESINTDTGEKTLEVIQTIVDAETGAEKDIVLTATLTLPVEDEEETTIHTVGKIAKVTRKVVDGVTGTEIEPEKVIFTLFQEVDTETNKMTYTVIQDLDPTELENYQRHQNLRVYFRWKDTEDNTMDNLADTQFRGEVNPDENIDNTILKYQAILKFKQYVQE